MIILTLAGENTDYPVVTTSRPRPRVNYQGDREHWEAFVASVQDLGVPFHQLQNGQDYFPVYLDYNGNRMIELETSRSPVRFTGVFGSALQFTFPGDYTIYMTSPEYTYQCSCYLVVDTQEARDTIITLATLNFAGDEWLLIPRAFREDGVLRRVVHMAVE